LKKKSTSGTLLNPAKEKKGALMNYKILYQWQAEIASRLMSLNSWQQENVGLFSLAIVEAENCQQGAVARKAVEGEKVESTARRFRNFLANEAFPLDLFFGEWTKWVISVLPDGPVHLLVDETKLGDRIGTMLVGVAWEKRCIPLSWWCYKANSHQDYPVFGQVKLIEWLLKAVQAGMPKDRLVIVMADRGIGTSPDLCRAVDDMGWKYLFRVTRQSKICTETGDFAIADMVEAGEIWEASGKVFKQRGQIPAHARAIWADGYEGPWALVTNHAPLTGFEYACRNWQEQSFRDLKSGGWQWSQSRIRLPDHMERLLVLLALAYAWMLALGSQAIARGFGQPLQRHPDGQLRRHGSLFKEGLTFFVEFVKRRSEYLQLSFVPDTRFR